MTLAEATGEAAKAGPMGILVIALLCIACYFIFRSMSKHLRRVREEFPYGSAPGDSSPSPPSDDRADRSDKDSRRPLTS